MRLWVNVIAVLMLFSGCATKKVTKMADRRSVHLFKVERITSANFNPEKNTIFLDMELIYRGEKKNTKRCFEFAIDRLEGGYYFPFVLEDKFSTRCSEIEKGYIYMPIKIGKIYYLNDDEGQQYIPVKVTADAYCFLSEHTAKSPFVPWRIEANRYRLYLRHSTDKESFHVTVPQEKEANNPTAYFLYPFSLTLDIVTLPITAPFYIVYFAYNVYFQNAMLP